jgi:hypothetical protein
LIRRARAERRPLPDRITKAPQLLPGLGFYFQAFLALSSCRPLGMSEGRIPWTAAYQYGQNMGLDPDEFTDLWILVSYMDAEYLKVRHQQAENARRRPSE